jgi:putative membrane protein
MSKTLIAALLATGMAAFSAPAFAQGAQTATKEDQTFLTKAIEGGLAEVEMGKLAQEKGQSQDVKNFGAMLVQDHTDANTKAMDLAKQINLTNAPSQPSKKQQADHDRLAKLSGAQFDSEFAKHMVTDHKEDIADFTKQSKMKAGDPTVEFASQTLPVLQKHLQAAEALEKGAKK